MAADDDQIWPRALARSLAFIAGTLNFAAQLFDYYTNAHSQTEAG